MGEGTLKTKEISRVSVEGKGNQKGKEDKEEKKGRKINIPQ